MTGAYGLWGKSITGLKTPWNRSPRHIFSSGDYLMEDWPCNWNGCQSSGQYWCDHIRFHRSFLLLERSLSGRPVHFTLQVALQSQSRLQLLKRLSGVSTQANLELSHPRPTFTQKYIRVSFSFVFFTPPLNTNKIIVNYFRRNIQSWNCF